MSSTMATSNVAGSRDVLYYYLRDRYGAPLVTVCLCRTEEGKYTRGISICSDLDQPNKEKSASDDGYLQVPAQRIHHQRNRCGKIDP